MKGATIYWFNLLHETEESFSLFRFEPKGYSQTNSVCTVVAHLTGSGILAWKGNMDWGSCYVGKGGFGLGQNPNTGKLGFGLGPSLRNQSKGNLTGKSTQGESHNIVQQGSTNNNNRSFTNDRNRGTKHLPYAELMNRKAQGLCFRCGEKYNPLHRCTEKQLRLIVLRDGETVNEEGEVIEFEEG
ncbi:hypothetical protein OROGR_027711 [Orobanche gracilis]